MRERMEETGQRPVSSMPSGLTTHDASKSVASFRGRVAGMDPIISVSCLAPDAFRLFFSTLAADHA